MTGQPSRKKRWPLILGGVLLVAAVIVGTMLFFTHNDKPLSWQDEFNKQNGTSVLIDISDDHPRHLINYDFYTDAQGNVTSYHAIVCWGLASDTRMQDDAWDNFSNEIRKYYTIKLSMADTSESVDGHALTARHLTVLLPQPLSPDEAKASVGRVSQLLWDYGPCKMN